MVGGREAAQVGDRASHAQSPGFSAQCLIHWCGGPHTQEVEAGDPGTQKA